MPAVRASADFDAPLATVAGAMCSVQVLHDSARPLGHRVEVPGRSTGLLHADDVVRLRMRAAGLPFWLTMRVVWATLDGHETRMRTGPFTDVRHTTRLQRTEHGIRLTAQLQWRGWGALADTAIFRRLAEKYLQARLVAVRDAVAQMTAAEEVVAGAVVQDGTVLLACRAHPPELAGEWELPGGGAEPGESPAQALRRELDEELGVQVEAGTQLGADVPLSDGRVLRCYRVSLLSGVPEARAHSALRWVDADQLWTIDMVSNDRAWRPELAALLAR